MKNKELFEKTVSILVKAYQNDTLMSGEPCACAVGNIIAHNMSYKMDTNGYTVKWPVGINNANWYDLLVCQSQFLKESEIKDALKDIISTGYSGQELVFIEKSFESWDNVRKESEIFDKLMNTIDCLMEIHEANNYEANIAKSLFVKETV